MEDAERGPGVWSGRSPESREGMEPETRKAEEQGRSRQRDQHCRGIGHRSLGPLILLHPDHVSQDSVPCR